MGEDGDRGSGVGQGDAKRARTSGEVAPQEAAIIDGAGMAAQIRAEVAEEVKALKLKAGRAPGLAVVIAGERKDSQTYVRNKVKACSECGIASTKLELPESTTEAELIEQVRALNADPLIDGILVQLPLPAHITESKVLDEITLDKDVDGFHPSNLGLLAKRARKALAVPCTPLGVMEMLSRSGVTVQGANAVVIGRSDIVGIPVALLLLHANASVQILHSKTPQPELERAVAHADILVACVGVAGLVKGEWVKEGACVIDVGINSVSDASRPRGYRLVGDVDFEGAKKRAGKGGKITPVPGGVGPMTIAMLLKNTVGLAAARLVGDAREAIDQSTGLKMHGAVTGLHKELRS